MEFCGVFYETGYLRAVYDRIRKLFFVFLMAAVLTVGITYVDPSTGESYTVGMSEMENMTEAGGNTFIGYIR